MSESVLAEGTWAEDGDSDIDMKPLPPSPVVEPQKVLSPSPTSGTKQLNNQENFSLKGEYYSRHSQYRRGEHHHSAPVNQLRRREQHYPSRGGSRGYQRQGGGETNIPIPDCPPFKAFIGNLPLDVDARFLKDQLFHGHNVLYCHIPNPRKGSGANPDSQIAYVEFADQASLRDALHRDGTQIRGQNIRVSVAQPRQGEYRQQPKQEFGDQRFGRDSVQPRGSGHFPTPPHNLMKANSAPAGLSSSIASAAGTGARKKLVLQPRSKPKEDTTFSPPEGAASSSSIFGGGKPRDEKLYKAEKKNENKEERQKLKVKPVERRTTKSSPSKQPIQIQSRKTSVIGSEKKQEKEQQAGR